METCHLCPRDCGVVRPQGYCGMGKRAVIARAVKHFWEEPCISGERGSGTVFFAGCPLGCVYCQNDAISRRAAGDARFREVDARTLRQICTDLAATGVHNINFVTPTHYADVVADAIGDGLGLPVVYNTGGYEKLSTLQMLRGKVQIYLPDLKYADSALAARYSHAPDYPAVSMRAIEEMVRQTGPYELDENGLMKRGVLIRHLVLPSCSENTRRVIEWVNNTFASGEVLFSLMGQFTPRRGTEERYPELSRPLTEAEYARACDWVSEADHLEGYVQELSAAGEDYIPEWGKFEG